LCHYFLLWVGNPAKALIEMKRTIKDGGILVCFAEPDYGGRLDYPIELNRIRELQIAGMINAGADPEIGRKLKSLFYSLGLKDIQVGVYEGNWTKKPSTEMITSEWKMLEHDLQDIISNEELAALKKEDEVAQQSGTRLIYVPTFYAWGIVNK
jgi:ubiquinone/menaquinone biosynthesis C-methylase UbiE